MASAPDGEAERGIVNTGGHKIGHSPWSGRTGWAELSGQRNWDHEDAAGCLRTFFIFSILSGTTYQVSGTQIASIGSHPSRLFGDGVIRFKQRNWLRKCAGVNARYL